MASAAVWLAATDGKWHSVDGLPIVANARTSSDGSFEVMLGEFALRQLAHHPREGFEVWVRKPGLALAYLEERGGLPDHPLEIRLRPEERLTLRLLKPDGSPCSNATVAPISSRYGEERFVSIPETIWNELKIQSGADGSIQLAGLGADELEELRVETPEFGMQCCSLRHRELPDPEPAKIKLRKTGSLEGRLVLPKGCREDLAGATVHILSSQNSPANERAWWHEHLVIRPDHDGRFVVSKLGAGSLQIVVDVPEDSGFRPETRQAFSKSPGAVQAGATTKIDIPLSEWVRVTRTVRDMQTKQPLADVAFDFIPQNSAYASWFAARTDENGRLTAWVLPNVTYESWVRFPEGYVRGNSATYEPVEAVSGAHERELEPIELVRGRGLDGTLVDPSGQPVGDVRIGASWPAPEAKPARRKN